MLPGTQPPELTSGWHIATAPLLPRPTLWQRLLGLLRRRGWYALGLLIAVSAGAWGGYRYGLSQTSPANSAPKLPTPVAFLMEIYDQVNQNYWDKISDSQLADLYRRAAEKITSVAEPVDPPTRQGVQTMLTQLFQPLDQSKALEVASNIGDIVVANLTPFARSRLYTNQKRTALQDQIKNVDQTTNLYDVLGVAKTAAAPDIQKAYQDKVKQLASSSTPQAQQQLAQVNRAIRTLGQPDTKQRYDQTGAEPTMSTRIIQPDILYVKINQIAPATVDEFQTTFNQLSSTPNLTSLILDLRGNNGGDIDTLPQLLGFFLGPNQTAFELWHQGDTTPIKTTTNQLASLVRFKKIVVLVDQNTESSAEVMAASLKKYRVGVLMGNTTHGWGTVETIYGLHTALSDSATYSLVLVHYVTLRDDEQPIEGRGVQPNISLDDVAWPQQLLAYFDYQPLVEAVKQVSTAK